MLTILYLLIGCIAGFLMAWFIKKQPASSAPDIALLQLQAALETEKKVVVNSNAVLQAQVDKLQQQLRATTSEAASAAARVEAEINNSNALKTTLEKLERKCTEAAATINSLDKQQAFLEAALKYKNEQLAHQKTELEQLGKKLETEFTNLAQSILNEKTKTFNEQQEKSLQDILKPLKENIETFKTEIGSRYDAESRERISLREQIKLITDTNQLLSEQANNLTNALRGQVKQQGNWGEMILESILEHSGLSKDLHYFVQQTVKDEHGQAFIPDIVIKYPDSRTIIVDSKVSLIHYEAYIQCKETVSQQKCLEQLLHSIRSHINDLSSKEYQQKVNALDFVMLFVPVEGAYIAAMQHDTDMWRYAYNKRVLLISPTNLIPAMKLVYDLWKKDDVNKDAQVIAAKAVKIYEKLAAFLEDFEKIGAQLEKATGIFADAKKKLHTGKGNLVAQAGHMKAKLKHDKPNRELPVLLVEQAMIEDEMPDEMER